MTENSPPGNERKPESVFAPELIPEQPTQRDVLVQELQEALVKARDARHEDQFVFVVVTVLLLDVVFFAIIPTLSGPIALLLLELFILLPLAKRMGMEEIAKILNRVIDRVTDGIRGNDRNGNNSN